MRGEENFAFDERSGQRKGGLKMENEEMKLEVTEDVKTDRTKKEKKSMPFWMQL